MQDTQHMNSLTNKMQKNSTKTSPHHKYEVLFIENTTLQGWQTSHPQVFPKTGSEMVSPLQSAP